MFEQLDKLIRALESIADRHRPSWPHWAEICAPKDLLENGLREAVAQSEYQESLDRLEDCWRLLGDSDPQSAVDYCLKIHHMSDRNAGERLYRNARARIATALAAVAANRCVQDRIATADLGRWLNEAVQVLGGSGREAVLNLDCTWAQSAPPDMVRQACTELQAINKDPLMDTARLWTLDFLQAGDSEVERVIAVPVAGCDDGTGFVLDLGLALIRGSRGGSVEHPRMALRVFGTDMLETIRVLSPTVGEPTLWELHARDPKLNAVALDGSSLGGALAVGLEMLWQLRPYDRSCVVLAAVSARNLETVGEQQGGLKTATLGIVGHEREKLEGMLRAGLRRAVVAKGTKIEGVLRESFLQQGLKICECATISQAVEFASGQLEELRAVLQCEAQRIFDDASSRMRRRIGAWQDLDSLFVPVRVARGLRPRLSQAEYEDMERQRREGQHEALDKTAWRRRALLGMRTELSEDRVQEQLRRKTENWEQVRTRLKRSVVLGDPGFGKTTLLWHEVGRRNHEWIRRIERNEDGLDNAEVAIFVHALELAQWLLEKAGGAVLDVIIARRRDKWRIGGTKEEHILAKPVSDATADVVRAKLSDGAGLIAIDALDEVPLDLRDKLDSALADFGGAHPRAKLLLSSRLVTYAGPPIPVHEDDQLEVLAFEPRQIEQAVRAWFLPDSKAGEDAWRYMESQRDVAGDLRCPLLLRLACRLIEEGHRWEGSRRPNWETRCNLYKDFIDDAVRKWIVVVRPHPGPTDVALFLGFAADFALELWKEDPHRTLWEARDVAAKIRKVKDARDIYKDLKRADLINDLCSAGILSLAGSGEPSAPLMFTHRTFGEYLAARSLAEELEKPEAEWGLVDRKAWDPEWEQVILFLAGTLSRRFENITKLLGILTDSSTDDAVHYRLALAGKCIVELSAHTVQMLGDLVADISDRVFSRWIDVGTPGSLSALVALARADTKIGGSILDRMLAQLHEPPSWEREKTVQGLTAMGLVACRDEVLGSLLELLENPGKLSADGDEPAESVRRASVEALSTIGAHTNNSRVFARLEELLNYPNRDVQIAALEVISGAELAWPSDHLRDKLVELLGDTNVSVVTAAVHLLCRIKEAASWSDVVIRLLKLTHHQDSTFRLWAVRGLANLGNISAAPEIVNRLLALLLDPHWYVRQETTRLLVMVGEKAGHGNLLACFERLFGHSDFYVRRGAIEGLVHGVALAKQEEAFQRIAELLRDPDESTVNCAVSELLNIVDHMGMEAFPDDIVNELVKLLHHSNNEIIWWTTLVLGKMGTSVQRKDIFDGLLELMWSPGSDCDPETEHDCDDEVGSGDISDESDSEYDSELDGYAEFRIDKEDLPESAFDALAQIGMGCPAIVNELLNWLNTNESRFWRYASALAELGAAAAREDVIDRLLDVLRDPWDHHRLSITLKLLECMGRDRGGIRSVMRRGKWIMVSSSLLVRGEPLP